MNPQESCASWDSGGTGSWRRPPPARFIPVHRPVPWGRGRLPEAGLCSHGGCLATGPQGTDLDQKGQGWTRGDKTGPQKTRLDHRGPEDIRREDRRTPRSHICRAAAPAPSPGPSPCIGSAWDLANRRNLPRNRQPPPRFVRRLSRPERVFSLLAGTAYLGDCK